MHYRTVTTTIDDDDVIKSFERGDSVLHAAVLDFSKVFDRVSHHLLVTKLITTGFSPTIVKWISTSLLFNRYQRVVIYGGS